MMEKKMRKDNCSENDQRQQTIQLLRDIVINNSTALLVTSSCDQVIRSRPMININNNFDGELYLIADENSDVCKAVIVNQECNISISEPNNGNYVSISGHAEIVDDPKKLELLWNTACKKWFDSETPAPDLRLVKVDVRDAEVWSEDRSLGGRIGSFLTHTELSLEHAKVHWLKEAASRLHMVDAEN